MLSKCTGKQKFLRLSVVTAAGKVFSVVVFLIRKYLFKGYSHCDIFVLHPPNPHPEALHHIIADCKGCAIKPLPYLQCDTSTSPALPIPPQQPAALHPSTPIVGLVPPSLTHTSDIVALGAGQGFQFILFVSHPACLGVQAFQIRS